MEQTSKPGTLDIEVLPNGQRVRYVSEQTVDELKELLETLYHGCRSCGCWLRGLSDRVGMAYSPCRLMAWGVLPPACEDDV